jgi:Skp family chaperone for outer membrane proteins
MPTPVRVLSALALGLGLTLAAAPATGQDAAPAEPAAEAEVTGALYIGFVDVELVIDRSRAIRAALQEIDRDMAVRARTIDEMERGLRRRQLELDRQSSVLSTAELDKLRGELLELTDELGRARFEFEQTLRTRERQLEPVLQRIMELVAVVAEREGFEIVLRGEVVLYGARSADLTPLVIRELDGRAEEILALFRMDPRVLTNDTDGETTGTSERVGGLPVRRATDSLPLIP